MLTLIKKLFNRKKTDFAGLIKQGALIIDVRTPGEFSSGHIKSSRNIPLDQLKAKIADLKKLNKPVITVCRSGARSAMAKSQLVSNGLIAYNGGPWNVLENKI